MPKADWDQMEMYDYDAANYLACEGLKILVNDIRQKRSVIKNKITQLYQRTWDVFLEVPRRKGRITEQVSPPRFCVCLFFVFVFHFQSYLIIDMTQERQYCGCR